MFGNSHLDRVQQMFADQFQSDGDGIVYRKNLKGPPVPLTAAERDHFIADFNRAFRWSFMGLVASLLVGIATVVAIFVTIDQDPPDALIYGLTFLVAAGFMAIFHLVWNAPARVLGGRTAAGPALSRGTRRELLSAA